jgi:hypothetical protein
MYAPARAEGVPDPTRSGFPTEEAAWEFVFGSMCRKCREEHDRALTLSEEEREESADGLFPACACEWFVLSTADYKNSAGFDDILDAAGFTEIAYSRPEPARKIPAKILHREVDIGPVRD